MKKEPMGSPEMSVTTKRRCVTSQKSKDLNEGERRCATILCFKTHDLYYLLRGWVQKCFMQIQNNFFFVMARQPPVGQDLRHCQGFTMTLNDAP
jgi:hypothetical protein